MTDAKEIDHAANLRDNALWADSEGLSEMARELNSAADAFAEQRATIEALRAQLALPRRLETDKRRRVTMCAFCDYTTPDGTIAEQVADVTRHVLECAEHPLMKRAQFADARLAALREAGAHLPGCGALRCSHRFSDKTFCEIPEHEHGKWKMSHDFQPGECSSNCPLSEDWQG